MCHCMGNIWMSHYREFGYFSHCGNILKSVLIYGVCYFMSLSGNIDFVPMSRQHADASNTKNLVVFPTFIGSILA